MTEMERLLKETLAQLEQHSRNEQGAQTSVLQHQSMELANLKKLIQTLQAEQSALSTQLTHLSSVYESLQPLLVKLNGLLSVK